MDKSPPPIVRLATADDLPDILAISNDAAIHTAANFAVEPESLESWRRDWRDTRQMFPRSLCCSGWSGSTA